MIIVSDTTPIRYLVAIKKIDILEKLFGRIIIPEKVYSELQGSRTPQPVKDWIISKPDWLEVRTADKSMFTPEIEIHAGEHEAIALALELHADIVLMDDRDARQEAKRIGLTVLPTLGLLDRAAEKGLVDIAEAIDLLKKARFYVSPELCEQVLERDRQRKQKL